MNTEKLLDFFQNIVPLNDDEKACVSHFFTLKKYRRRQIILQEGDYCKNLYFVVEGCIRMYKINSQGNENNTEFSIENQWITDYESFFQQIPSKAHLEALQSAVLLEISKENLEHLYQKSPKFETIFRMIFAQKTIDYQKYIQQIASANSLERYLVFEKEYPQLIGKIPQVQIASFLGITPECISRIKNSPFVQKESKD